MLKNLVIQDYIKTMTHIQLNRGNPIIKLNDVAKKLSVSPAAVSDMVKKLVREGLIINPSYQGVELTPEGYQMGVRLIRHHRLWEVFLHQTLQVPWDEVHDEAEHLEHAASDALMNRMDAYLNYPTVDPHGNPIPTITGEVAFNRTEIPLSKATIGSIYSVTRFESLDPSYLNYLSQQSFSVGETINVMQRFSFDNSLVVNINTQDIQLSHAIAQRIFIVDTATEWRA
ncbi:MAG: metal-dependent transcriptional regulator [Candidatus Marinamargulisbacteria bacterium]